MKLGYCRSLGVTVIEYLWSQSQWPLKGVGLRPLACWVESSNIDWNLDVYCECCVLSRRGLCEGPISRPSESCCGCGCNREAWTIRRPWPISVSRAIKKISVAIQRVSNRVRGSRGFNFFSGKDRTSTWYPSRIFVRAKNLGPTVKFKVNQVFGKLWSIIFYFNTCTVHLLLFFIITNAQLIS
jgi:hypothetical protein